MIKTTRLLFAALPAAIVFDLRLRATESADGVQSSRFCRVQTFTGT
jgi:hypothetical protein